MNYEDVGSEFKIIQFLFDKVTTPIVSAWLLGLGASLMAWDAWKRIAEGGKQ